MTSLSAEIRTEQGSSHARRLRRRNRVPAIIYGLKGKENSSLSLCHNEMIKLLKDRSSRTKMLSLHISGHDKPIVEQVIIKAIQRHPVTRFVVHTDLLRVDAKTKIIVMVPFQFINEEKSPGVREGGVVNHITTQIEVQCLPGKIPAGIEVDLSSLKLNESIYLSDIKIPEGVELTLLKQSLALASVHIPTIKEESEAVETDEDAEDGEDKDDKSKE